jgi:hypothetical protein
MTVELEDSSDPIFEIPPRDEWGTCNEKVGEEVRMRTVPFRQPHIDLIGQVIDTRENHSPQTLERSNLGGAIYSRTLMIPWGMTLYNRQYAILQLNTALRNVTCLLKDYQYLRDNPGHRADIEDLEEMKRCLEPFKMRKEIVPTR